MSFPCVLGMHEVAWDDGAYHNESGTAPAITRNNNGGTQTQNGNFELAGKSNGEVVNYLFQRQGVAASFSKTTEKEEGSYVQHRWTVGEGMSEKQKQNGVKELDEDFKGMTLAERKTESPMQEIVPTAKKLWEVQDREPDRKTVGNGIFGGDQWHENAWGPSVPHVSQSEHAVSQPIMVKRPQTAPNFNSEPHNILSPRSADGGLGLSMVEYVLASSPGGADLEAQMAHIKPTFGSPPQPTLHENKPNSNGVSGKDSTSPFEEETAEQIKQSLQRDETESPIAATEEEPNPFSRTPGSRQPSPTSSNSPDGQQTSQAQSSQAKPIPTPSVNPNLVSSSGSLTDHFNSMNFETIGFDYPASQAHIIGSPNDAVMLSSRHPHAQQINAQLSAQQQQQQQQLALAAAQQQQQQQQLGIQSNYPGSPYFIAASTQDPYGNVSLAALNPAGPAVVHPQYAYNVPQWGMYSAASNTGGFQQQQAQLLRTSTGTVRNANEALAAAAVNQGPSGANYQLIAQPGAHLGIGAPAFYDQSGNPVMVGNGQGGAVPLTNQLGAPLRVIPPVVLNSTGGAPSPMGNRMGNGNAMNGAGMRIINQQQQQQQQQQSSMNMQGYMTNSHGNMSGMQMSNNNLGMVNNSGLLSGSSSVGPIGSGSRRDPMTSSDYNKRQSLAQFYGNPGPSMGGLGGLTVSTQHTQIGVPPELQTPPLLSQSSQSGFSVGSPVSSSLSRYMGLSSTPGEKKYSTYSSLASSMFGSNLQGYRTSRVKDTGRSQLLEDFRNNRYPNIQLRDLANHIVEFSQDQHGSRFIQQKLERATLAEKQMVFNEILPAAYRLMTDVFGNYVIQKFFEFGTKEQKQLLANCIRGHVLPLALQMYGCRVIQKALESIPPEMQNELVRELDGHVMKCVKDQNGNHVVQKCIECVEPPALQFIIHAFKGQQVFALSTHPYGCRVIQRILEHCTPDQTAPILEELHEQTERLVQDQYGNYVIQHVLEHGTHEDKAKIVSQLRGKILLLSQHKFASNVVEKCVSHASRQERAVLIDEVCQGSEGSLYTMMKDQYANYVVQKMIDVAEPPQRKLLMHKIRPHIQTLRKYTYGKHILAKLEKFYMKAGPADLVLNGPLL